MNAIAAIPPVAWCRRFDEVPRSSVRPEEAPLSMIWQAKWNWWRRPKNSGPIIDMEHSMYFAPLQGVPLGGLGGGSIGRGWRGEFRRWHFRPGQYSYRTVPADQFSVYVGRPGQKPQACVLAAMRPETDALQQWKWDLSPTRATCYALYPRAWMVYEAPLPGIRLICRQISPLIPHNYRESSFPCGVFVWEIENTAADEATVGLMFTFQNGYGNSSDLAGGHVNRAFSREMLGGKVIGVTLQHRWRQPKIEVRGQAMSIDREVVYEDPLTFAVAAQATSEVEVTYRTRFVTTESGMDVWGDFAEDGRMINSDDERPAQPGMAIGAAVAATVKVPPRAKREVVFALAWDMPLARFGSGTAYYRRYTRFYGRNGTAAPQLVADALTHYSEWEEAIVAWQRPILTDETLPAWYRSALFNELYYLADGGTIWTDGEENEPPPPAEDNGHFAYLESHEYLLYNTYDVHFYASFALIQLWPELELSLQRDFARAIFMEHSEKVYLFGSGKYARRKVVGAVPHDIGHPCEDPWRKVNAYDYQDAMRWKDLNSKFVLQVYRDYVATGDRCFVAETWAAVQAAVAYLQQFDRDGDGVIDNEGFPDQTYDVWSVRGASAYSGGLWLGCLSAAAALAAVLGQTEAEREYRAWLDKGVAAYEARLWNGRYYNYDSSSSRQHNSIMADQVAGHWYVHTCGLPPLLPGEHVRSALQTVYAFNVQRFQGGTMGAVNGMRPDGRVDKTCLQSQEVWAGITYAVAAAMLQVGLRAEAFQTAWGVYHVVYEQCGYWFQTPEAWNAKGDYRAPAYMRPLAIWAMQWSLEKESQLRPAGDAA